MGDTLAQDRFPMPEPFLTKVLEFAPLEQIPHAFLRIEFWCVARQALQMDAFSTALCQKILDSLAAVDASG